MVADVSILQVAEINSAVGRAVSGGVSGGLAAVVAFNTAATLAVQTAIVGVLTFLCMLVLGVGYNTVVENDEQADTAK